MDAITNLLRLVDAFAAARRISDARASTLIFGDGTRVKHLRAGGDMGVHRIDRAMAWLSANWPDAAAWPDDVLRPVAEALPSHSPVAPQPAQGVEP